MAAIVRSRVLGTLSRHIVSNHSSQTGIRIQVAGVARRSLVTESVTKRTEDYLDPEWVASIKFGTLKHKRYLLSLDYIDSIKRSEVTFFLTGEFPSMEASTMFRIQADKCGFVTRQVKTSILQVISPVVNLPPGLSGGKLYMLTLKEGINSFSPAQITKLEKLIGPYSSSKVKDRELTIQKAAFHLVAAQVQGETMSRDEASLLLSKMKASQAFPGEEVLDYQRVFVSELVAKMNAPAQGLVRPLEQMLGEIPRTLTSATGAMSQVLGQVEQLRRNEEA